MNSARGRPVQAIAAVAVTALVLGTEACVQVDGGALELSWALRTFEGNVIDSSKERACERARIAEVRVCWQPVGDAGTGPRTCRPERSRTFRCDRDRGVTEFEVEPGPVAMWIEPLCADGELPAGGTYEVPAPVVRRVEEGALVALQALLVVASDGDIACPPAGCTCAR